MQADELGMAVTKVVEVLNKAQIASVVEQYRASKGDAESLAGLKQAASKLLGQFESLGETERQITKSLHLDSLGSRHYWVELFGSTADVKKHQGEIVRLASRIMFASNHLPGLLNLMGGVPAPQMATQALDQGDDYLCIRLTDAGERASDPDRVARSIDGIDMLYSACASIARKPAIDIRIDSVNPKRNRDRDIVFAGEKGSVAAVYAVINSIPVALAELDPEQEINLDNVVQSLPIFEDLNTLASVGAFSKQDLKDIRDTMHQGALLTLESGVIPVDATEIMSPPKTRSDNGVALAKSPVAPANNTSKAPKETPEPASPVEQDEHYERYLREREAMLRPQHSNDSATRTQISDNPLQEEADELLGPIGQRQGP